MMLLLLFYLSLPVGLFLLSALCEPKLKRRLIASSLFFLCLPIVATALIFLLKNPIQRGKIFPAVAPLIVLAFPPDDLFLPLASSPLDPNKSEYVFSFTHNYVGNHQLDISFPSIGTLVPPKHNLKVSLKVIDGEKTLLDQPTATPTPYWGVAGKQDGLLFISYRVPNNLPVSKTLTAVVRVSGDIKEFAERYGPATLVLRKGSDM